MIVRGDRLAESQRVNALSLLHAGLWALLLANPRAVDDFGMLRWEAAFLIQSLFPRRLPTPLRAVRSFMAAVEEVGLVGIYTVEGVTFAEVRAWSGVEPAKRRFHRYPLPPWSAHECVAACAKSGARVEIAWHQVFGSEVARTEATDLAPDCVPVGRPDVAAPFGSPTSPTSPTSPGSSGAFGSPAYGCTDESAEGELASGAQEIDLENERASDTRRRFMAETERWTHPDDGRVIR